MADCTFWHSLAEDFKSLDPAQTLSIKWQYTSGEPGQYRYTLEGGSDLLRLSYKRLALKAAEGLGDQASFDAWCTELRKRDNDARNSGPVFGPEILSDGKSVWYQTGRIPKVAEVSACLCIDLEIQEIELQRRTPVGKAAKPSEPDPINSTLSNEAVSAAPDANVERTRPGPVPKRDEALLVKRIVSEIAAGKRMRKHLDAICEALDNAEVTCPKTWLKREPPILDWADAAATEPDLAKKAIEHRLKIARD